MIEKCIIEFGGKRREVSGEEIRKLKLILDELNIMHIIDNVNFCTPCGEAGRTRDPSGIKKWKTEDRKDISLEDEIGHSGQLEFRELIIPYVFDFDYLTLAQLDYEDAELLGDLLYGTE